MGATGTLARVSRANHRYPGRPCSKEVLTSRTEQKIHFDQKSRPWFAVAMFCWTLLSLMGVARVMLNHNRASVNFFESLSSRRQRSVIKKGNFMDSAIFEFDSPPVKNDDALIDPKTPASPLVVLVLSKRDHFQRRSMIRRTWGKAYTSGLYFVIGGVSLERSVNNTSDEVQRLLIEEQVQHWDMIDTLHPESYRGLPHKIRFAIRWVIIKEHDRKVQWILKVDDDMYVRHLNVFVRRDRSVGVSILNSTFPIVVGQIQYQIPVQRHGKWAEDASYYRNHPIYPPWPKGSSGYLISRSAAVLIAQRYSLDLMLPSSMKEKPALPSYQGEDTSLGIWLEASNVSWINSTYFVNHGRCLPDLDSAWIIGHRITPELMQKCYETERMLIRPSDSSPSIEDTTILEVLPTSQDQWFTNAKDANTEAFMSAMLHSELDQKSIRNDAALEQRRQQREAKRHEHQMLRLSDNNL
jgi:Galactosyltransferase